jgi:hypothetical protein
MNVDLTADELRALLHYDPLTGEFVWAARPRSGVKAGQPAGNKSPLYHRIRINRIEYKAHRLAWLYVHGRWPTGVIDHINGDKLDNRLANLRECSQSENLANRTHQKNSKSGMKGVGKLKGHDLWRATLCGQHLGTFKTAEEAASAYRAAAAAKFGEFAAP